MQEANSNVYIHTLFLLQGDISHCCYRYPDYEFFGDTSISQSAGMSSRYTDASLRGVIIDIEMLSMTDYLVCTFSSQVSPIYPAGNFDLLLPFNFECR